MSPFISSSLAGTLPTSQKILLLTLVPLVPVPTRHLLVSLPFPETDYFGMLFAVENLFHRICLSEVSEMTLNVYEPPTTTLAA